MIDTVGSRDNHEEFYVAIAVAHLAERFGTLQTKLFEEKYGDATKNTPLRISI